MSDDLPAAAEASGGPAEPASVPLPWRLAPMGRSVLAGSVLGCARSLLRTVVVSDLDGVIVAVQLSEVEAYGGVGEDPGSHAHRGVTPRTESMFAAAGTAYVYRSYGIHWCLNVVTGRVGKAAAVLLRSGEVIHGLEHARTRRGGRCADSDLARGPGRLGQALGIDARIDGLDLLDPASPLRLHRIRRRPSAAASDAPVIDSSPRTGVSGEGGVRPWRFYLRGGMVSPYRPATARGSGAKPSAS